MNYPERVSLIHSATDEEEATATVSLISAKEGVDGAFLITDVSVRVPPGYRVLDNSASVRVLTGPLAGDYGIQQVRPNRHHTRYVVRRVS